MADPYLRQLQARNLMLRMQAEQRAREQFAQMQAARQAQMAQQQAAQQGGLDLRAQALAQSGQFNQANILLRAREVAARERYMREQSARQAEQERQREMDRKRGALRPGYRWNAEDPMKMELVPGGPEEQKMRGAHAEDLARAQSINNATQALIARVGSILRPSNKSGFQGNFGMIPEFATRYLPGKNYNTLTELEQLQDMLKTSGLNDIRGRSGQSIGAITEREWPILAGQLAKLNVGMTDDAARTELMNLRRRLLGMRNKEFEQYKNEWSPTPFYQKTVTPVPQVEMQGPAQGIPKTFGHGKEIWDNLTPEEKELWMPGISQQN